MVAPGDIDMKSLPCRVCREEVPMTENEQYFRMRDVDPPICYDCYRRELQAEEDEIEEKIGYHFNDY